MRILSKLVCGTAFAAMASVPAVAQYMDMEDIKASAAKAENFPSGPIDFVCTTSPGSSVAVWCQNLARGFSDELGVPVAGNKYVRGFDVPMHHVACGSVFERFSHLYRVVDGGI